MRSWRCRFLSSLRTRLVFLVLLAVVPALGLILYTAAEQRRTATTEAQANTLRLVRLAANNHRQVVEGNRQLLTILAQIPVVRQGNSAQCNQLLADLLKQQPTYANFAVFNPQGQVICSAIPYSSSVNVADRSYFQRALQSRKFAVGDYQIGRITKKPTVNFAYPILDKTGRVQSVVSAALNLAQLNQLAAEVKLPKQAVLSIVDNQGIILARYPEPQTWVGKPISQQAFNSMKIAGGEGVYEVLSLDGIRRIFAFSSLGDDPLKPDAYIRVGIPISAILDEADWLLVHNLVGLGAVTILALIAAWVGGDIFLIRQIKSLVQTAETLGSGELNARTAIRHTAGEIGQLARAIDEMAAALQKREEAIASVNQDLKTLFELVPIGILIAQDSEFRQVKANPAFARILGISPEINVSYTPINTEPPTYKILREGKELAPEEFPLRYAAIHKTEVKGTEVDIVRGDGIVFNLFGYAAPLLDDLGNVRGSVAAFLDISDRALAESHTRQLISQIQTQANVLHNILWASVDHIFIFDPAGRYQYVSHGGAALMNLKSEDLVGKTWREVILSADITETMYQLDSQRTVVMVTGESIKAETNYTAKDGVHYYEYILTPLQSLNQTIAGVIAVFRNITDRKQTEQALRQSEQRLRLAQRAAKIGTWEWNVRTDEVSWSEGIWDILGLQPGNEEPSLKPWVDHIHPEDRSSAMQNVERIFAQGEDYYDEFRIIRDDGVILWLASKGRVIRDADGQVERFLGVNIDISERKRAEEILRASEERFQAFMAHSPASSWISDADGRIVYLSPTYFRTFQLPTDDVIGKSVFDVYDAEIAQQFLDNIRTVAISNQVLETMEVAPRTDGTMGDFLVYKFPIVDLSGQTLVGGVAIDVTERKRAEQEREQLLQREQAARETAETANRIKDEFLAVLSHELRTPLNPILGWTKLLRTGKLSEEKKAIALETIERNAKLQTQLIGDLLDISRILQGKLTLNISSVDLAATIEAAKETVRLAAEAKSIQIHTFFAPGVKPFMGDASRLQQVMWNLLSNAVKFTPEGGRVEVRLSVVSGETALREGFPTQATANPKGQWSVVNPSTKEEVRNRRKAKPLRTRGLSKSKMWRAKLRPSHRNKFVPHKRLAFSRALAIKQPHLKGLTCQEKQLTTDNGQLTKTAYAQIQVSDTGKGISREFLPYVFETFRQADSATTRQFGGLGLGLAIVRHIVEMHGGTVYAESAGEGQGATFTVQLPLSNVTPQVKQNQTESTNSWDLTKVRILVVDDELDTRELLIFMMQQYNAEVTAAASAIEALHILQHSQFDILVCDIAMPEMDGYTLIRQLRTWSWQQGGKIKAIALTAYAGEFNQQQALAAGFQKHLSKPVDPEELVQTIVSLIND